MPVEGQDLKSALEQARELITQAGFQHGQLLVLTGSSPSRDDIEEAKDLAKSGIYTSIIPTLSTDASLNPLFQELAKAGHGEVIPFSDTTTDIEHWLSISKNKQRFSVNANNDIPVWRDEGRWFLIPALFYCYPHSVEDGCHERPSYPRLNFGVL